MTEREAFLKAICDSPDDDTPRLVYADWLTEHGEESRAEFIRVQCELARTPEFFEREAKDGLVDAVYVYPAGSVLPPDMTVRYQVTDGGGIVARWREPNPRHAELEARSLAMVEAFRSEWILPTPFTTQAEWDALDALDRPGVCTFRRGFLHSVTCPGDDWARHGDAVLREHPVREVTFTEFRSLHLPRSFYTGPFPNWLAIDEVFQEYRLLTHPETGEPVFTPTLVIWADVFTRRWPGVTFRPAE